jgi:hypothetical protein
VRTYSSLLPLKISPSSWTGLRLKIPCFSNGCHSILFQWSNKRPGALPQCHRICTLFPIYLRFQQNFPRFSQHYTLNQDLTGTHPRLICRPWIWQARKAASGCQRHYYVQTPDTGQGIWICNYNETTYCFRKWLPPGGRVLNYKNGMQHGDRIRIEIQHRYPYIGLGI